MLKRLLLIITLGAMLHGCFMLPMAMVGPAVSGFSTASIAQSGVTTAVSYLVKKSTGKTIAQHALDSISGEILKQTYLPANNFKSSNSKIKSIKNK